MEQKENEHRFPSTAVSIFATGGTICTRLFFSVLQYWGPQFGARDHMLILSVTNLCQVLFNLLPVDVYGNIQYWMSLVKVADWLFCDGAVAASFIAHGRFFLVET